MVFDNPYAQKHYSCCFGIPSKPTKPLLFSMQENCSSNKCNQLTSSMTPFRMSLDSTPTLRSSRHSLSNFSGVSLFSMLKRKKKKPTEYVDIVSTSHFKLNLSFYFWSLLKIEKCNFHSTGSFEPFRLWSIIENTNLLTVITVSVCFC